MNEPRPLDRKLEIELGLDRGPGWTARRLLSLNSRVQEKRANLLQLSKQRLPSDQAVANKFPSESLEFRLGVEGALLAQNFTPEIWRRAELWQKENGTRFGAFNPMAKP